MVWKFQEQAFGPTAISEIQSLSSRGEVFIPKTTEKFLVEKKKLLFSLIHSQLTPLENLNKSDRM